FGVAEAPDAGAGDDREGAAGSDPLDHAVGAVADEQVAGAGIKSEPDGSAQRRAGGGARRGGPATSVASENGKRSAGSDPFYDAVSRVRDVEVARTRVDRHPTCIAEARAGGWSGCRRSSAWSPLEGAGHNRNR